MYETNMTVGEWAGAIFLLLIAATIGFFIAGAFIPTRTVETPSGTVKIAQEATDCKAQGGVFTARDINDGWDNIIMTTDGAIERVPAASSTLEIYCTKPAQSVFHYEFKY